MDPRPVKIRLKSSLQGSLELFEYEGFCRLKGSMYCITYTDRSDASLTRVRIDAGQGGMTLHRQGSISTRMQYDPDRVTPVKYRADAFSAEFLLKTREYRFICGDSFIHIFLDYTLTETTGETVSQGRQEIEIRFSDIG